MHSERGLHTLTSLGSRPANSVYAIDARVVPDRAIDRLEVQPRNRSVLSLDRVRWRSGLADLLRPCDTKLSGECCVQVEDRDLALEEVVAQEVDVRGGQRVGVAGGQCQLVSQTGQRVDHVWEVGCDAGGIVKAGDSADCFGLGVGGGVGTGIVLLVCR